ncbi:UDP-3-O-[3-hydroxymyristoyl] N-acetylglucosamine deacetylase, partial [bacterium]|nr:UDP-3-O-[3-hydroxymyristoyl] N-acetylglucosamine deacetylase [bacterium]
MFLSNQTTLRQKVTFNGIGLHTGESTTVIVHPAAENTGINFIINGTIIPALIGFVSKTSYATQLHQGDVSIKTVEHLLSAFMGLGLTNALCEVIGPEIPIMDGSSWPFYFALKSVGLLHQKEPLKIAVVNKTVEVCYGESVGILSPSQDQSFEITLAYDHPFIKDNALSLRFSFSKNDYPTDIARARTYGFKKDIEFYKENNLARGADLTNSLVFDDHAILN